MQASWRNSHIQVAGSITSITAHLDCLRLLCEDGLGNCKWHAKPRPESHLHYPFHRCLLFLRVSRSLFPRLAIGGITRHPPPLFAPFLPSMSISLDMCAPGHPACVCGCGCVSFSMVLSGTRDALSPPTLRGIASGDPVPAEEVGDPNHPLRSLRDPGLRVGWLVHSEAPNRRRRPTASTKQSTIDRIEGASNEAIRTTKWQPLRTSWQTTQPCTREPRCQVRAAKRAIPSEEVVASTKRQRMEEEA